MSEIMTAKFSSNLNVSIDNALTLFTANDVLNQAFSQSFTNGTGDNQANKLYSAALQIASAGAPTSVNLFSFAGAKDSLGQTYALTSIKLLIVQNLSATAYIDMSADTIQGWFAIFGADGLTIRIQPGGTFIAIAPVSGGYAVSNTAKSVKFNLGSGVIQSFNLIVVGSQ